MNDVALASLLAATAWIAGFATGNRIERVRREERSWGPPARLIDLTEPARAYDWAVDGGGECPDCGGNGETIVADPFRHGLKLHAACPTCTARVTP